MTNGPSGDIAKNDYESGSQRNNRPAKNYVNQLKRKEEEKREYTYKSSGNRKFKKRVTVPYILSYMQRSFSYFSRYHIRRVILLTTTFSGAAMNNATINNIG